MPSGTEYIRNLQSEGFYHFSTEEAVRALGGTPVAVRAVLRRLKGKGMIATPHRGFHVIVPPEYRRLGCLPADQFLPDLMEHLGEPYYVGLLAAAAYHGASHQAPSVFQVVVPNSRRDVRCGSVRVVFVARRDMSATSTGERNTPTGIIRISSPEATALELVGYPEHCGYLDNIATVLAELAESMRGDPLAEEAARAPRAWVQRLGYLLCRVGASEIAAALDPVLHLGETFPVALAPWKPIKGKPRDPRWRIVVNVEVEPDL